MSLRIAGRQFSVR